MVKNFPQEKMFNTVQRWCYEPLVKKYGDANVVFEKFKVGGEGEGKGGGGWMVVESGGWMVVVEGGWWWWRVKSGLWRVEL